MLSVYAVDQATGDTVAVDNWGSLSFHEAWNDSAGGVLGAKDAGQFESAEWLEVLSRPFGSIYVTDEHARIWSGYPSPSIEQQSDTASVVYLAGDLCRLKERTVTPWPDIEFWLAATHRYYSGDARTVLRSLINDYCGPSSPEPVFPVRVVSSGVSAAQTAIAARAELNVLEWVKLKGIPSRERVSAVWNETDRVVDVSIEACEDHSNRIVFAVSLTNETAWKIKTTEPAYDTVIVLGQGEGAARQVAVRRSGRVGRTKQAVFDRRNIDNPTELGYEADELLAAGRGSTSITATLLETPGQTYGVDYRLGDLVKVTAAGQNFTEPVTSVLTQASADGGVSRTVTAGFGPLNPVTRTAADLAELSRKVSQIGAT